MAISGKLLLLRLNEALRARGSDGSAHDLFKLDENNKLQLLKLPQVASDASDANDLVRKSQVDFAVDGLDGRLDTAEGKLQVIEGDDQTAGSIAKAKKDSKDYVDQKIADLINSSPELLNTLQELAAAIDNDPQFAQTMAQQIGSLDGRIDTIEGDEFTSGSIAHAVKAERQRAELAEGALDSRLDTAESDINAIETQIASLGSNQAIVDLTNRVSDAEQDLIDIDGYNQDLRVDVDALEAAVAVLNGSSSVSGSVDQKVASAINAVIDGAPQAFDTLKEISDYISSDQSAGATMVSQIADHETRVASLESAMPSKASVSALSSEQSAREAADNALDARLDVVEALKKDVLTYESFTIDSSQLSAVTVQHAIKGMPFVIREGVMGRPGRDFTFSGAVITFAGEWVNPSGLSSVEVGTELDVAYMYETDAFSTSGGGGSGGGGGGGGGGPAAPEFLAGTSYPNIVLSYNGQTYSQNVDNEPMIIFSMGNETLLSSLPPETVITYKKWRYPDGGLVPGVFIDEGTITTTAGQFAGQDFRFAQNSYVGGSFYYMGIVWEGIAVV